MIANNTTLQQLRTLADLYEQGYRDNVVDLTIDKLYQTQLEKEEEQLAELRSELDTYLDTYEEQFGLSSEEFYERYQSGLMGDDAEIFEWSAIYAMYRRLRADINKLRNLNPR